MDLFTSKAISPMLIADTVEAFDDPQWLFELKFDGGRYLAYLDKTTRLVSRRGTSAIKQFPELRELHRQVTDRCILDGEIVTMVDGVPHFDEYLRRTTMKGEKIEKAAREKPVTFVVYDILYTRKQSLLERTLDERKAILNRTVKEGNHLALSRVIEGKGKAFFALTKTQGLEGIIGKKKDSLYHPGIRTHDWVKIKNVLDDDFVIAGYVIESDAVASLVLAQYARTGTLVYKGRVVIGRSNKAFQKILNHPVVASHPFRSRLPPREGSVTWIKPDLVCIVEFLSRSKDGLRHPVFKGIRDDKAPKEAREP